MKNVSRPPDYFLDISGDVCPMTFVRTRLSIEKMQPGEVLEVRLKGEEPLKNVPDSLTELGHRIVSLAREAAGPDGAPPAGDCYRLIVEKA